MPFVDCDYESKYISYIAAAYELGITKGTSQSAFSPYDDISREQLATMLYRVIKLAEINSTYGFDANNVRKFYDDSKISDYAKESVYFMAEYGIVKGVDGAHFATLATATKEQAILISVRCADVF
ncbi:MAG: S-layer homology domain-containing protein [Clostridia bacterium]|nr:S-layer homology domain-containing protein [Clostridia bacterium]